MLYENQLGGADDASLQEEALRQRAVAGASSGAAAAAAATAGEPSAAALEASLAAKSTASGAVRDVAFFDLDTAVWQVGRQHSLQYGGPDAAALPHLGRAAARLQGRRWLVVACENKVVVHDLASAQSRDIPRSSVFDSKAPTRVALLLMNLPALLGYEGAGRAAAPELAPVLAVGTASGATYLVHPDKMTVSGGTGEGRGSLGAPCWLVRLHAGS